MHSSSCSSPCPSTARPARQSVLTLVRKGGRWSWAAAGAGKRRSRARAAQAAVSTAVHRRARVIAGLRVSRGRRVACQDGAERTDERRAVSARAWPCHVRTSRGSPCRTLCLQTMLSQLSRAPVSTRKIRAQRSVYRGASRPSSTVSTRRPCSLPLLLSCLCPPSL